MLPCKKTEKKRKKIVLYTLCKEGRKNNRYNLFLAVVHLLILFFIFFLFYFFPDGPCFTSEIT